MPVTMLMVEREVIPGDQGKAKALLGELRSRATRQPGFISGQTVIDARSPCVFMTISTWSSMAGWESWGKDPERAEIIGRINQVLQETPTARMWLHDEDAPPSGV